MGISYVVILKSIGVFQNGLFNALIASKSFLVICIKFLVVSFVSDLLVVFVPLVLALFLTSFRHLLAITELVTILIVAAKCSAHLLNLPLPIASSLQPPFVYLAFEFP